MKPDDIRREPKAPREEMPRKTPNADMQADDAGTAESGVDEGRESAVDSAMKETSKTGSESGGRAS